MSQTNKMYHLLKVEDYNFETLYNMVKSYTMLSKERLLSLYINAHIVQNMKIPGSFVECGVWKGGTSAMLAKVMSYYNNPDYLFSCDSYCGLPEPDDNDRESKYDKKAVDINFHKGSLAANEGYLLSISNILGVDDRIKIVKGYFKDTLPVYKGSIGKIALLHMDGDWYSSTNDILFNLFDLLQPGAYVQIDDYGHWSGCKKAIHEFMEARNIDIHLKFIDYTGVFFYND